MMITAMKNNKTGCCHGQWQLGYSGFTRRKFLSEELQLHLSLDLKWLDNVQRGSNWQDKSPIRQKRGQMEEMGLSGELLILLDKKIGGNVGFISLVGHRWSQQ